MARTDVHSFWSLYGSGSLMHFYCTVVNDITKMEGQKKVQNKKELLLNNVEAMKKKMLRNST